MTYEYLCTACQHAWEADQSIKDPPLSECPSCHGQTAKRQISGGTGFVLKGGGWYADLYSSSSASKSAEASKTDGDSSAKSEKGSSSEKSSTEKSSSSEKSASDSGAAATSTKTKSKSDSKSAA